MVHGEEDDNFSCFTSKFQFVFLKCYRMKLSFSPSNSLLQLQQKQKLRIGAFALRFESLSDRARFSISLKSCVKKDHDRTVKFFSLFSSKYWLNAPSPRRILAPHNPMASSSTTTASTRSFPVFTSGI